MDDDKLIGSVSGRVPQPVTTIKDFIENNREDFLELFYGEWTTAPPTEPGWYWAMNKHSGLMAVKFPTRWDNGTVYIIDDERPEYFDGFTHWLGPLPEPEKPSRKEHDGLDKRTSDKAR